MESPVDYRALEQTVTVYRMADGQVSRKVYDGAYLQMQTQAQWDAQGRQGERKFLLILPGEGVKLSPGDRVYDGIGPQITAEQWSRFIPALVDGLGQIGYVKPYYWQGILSHTEAGR